MTDGEQRIEDLKVERVGRDQAPVTLHLMVKNGSSVVGRLLDCVGPYVRDVVAVFNDCVDDTANVLAWGCGKHDLYLQTCSVTRRSHPHLYLLDVPETYQVGKPLADEVLAIPHTGEPLLCDWSAARNVGWSMPSARWKLFLDADDVVDDPEMIPGLCRALDERGVEVAASRYHYAKTGRGDWRADAFRERLARDLPGIVWRDRVHEVLTGYDPKRVAQVEGSLVVRDLHDSAGEGLRPPGRNLKVLYHRGRTTGWDLTPRETVYLAAESQASMPDLCLALVKRYLAAPRPWPEEAGWACVLAGEVEETRQHYPEASRWYEESLRHHPGELAAYRLARSRFMEKKWEGSLLAYQLGVKNGKTVQLLDGGLVQPDAAKVLAVACLAELGRLQEARALCCAALARFPDSPALRKLGESLGRAT